MSFKIIFYNFLVGSHSILHDIQINTFTISVNDSHFIISQMNPRLSKPGSLAIGPSSPVQQALAWLETFFKAGPTPDIGTSAAQSNGVLLSAHLLHLLNGCGLLNNAGFHSASVSLLRSLEDALDCFGAVVLIKGAAEKWANRKLKASDAAKLWVPGVKEIATRDLSLAEYRKALRSLFNQYTHCSCDLCLWNLYFQPKEKKNGVMTGTLELNLPPTVIDSNGHSIDAHLTAHLLEFIILVKKAYDQTIQKNKENMKYLHLLIADIAEIMERHDQHRCQDVSVAPEIRSIKEQQRKPSKANSFGYKKPRG